MLPLESKTNLNLNWNFLIWSFFLEPNAAKLAENACYPEYMITFLKASRYFITE